MNFIPKHITMDFAFKKKNYLLLIVGLAFIASGLILMIGGGSEDPTKFSADIFDFQRLTLAPILLATGFIIEIIAIMYKSKDA
jgi:SNF family Na+-dependent transporter